MTMNDRLAVEPNSFSCSRDIKYLLEKCGFHQGRFIAEYPVGWVKLLRKEIDKLPELEQLRAKRVLERMREKAILPARERFDYGKTWVENAFCHKQSGYFSLVIGTKPPAINLDDIDESELGDSRGERVNQTAEEYARIAAPLLLSSSEIILIDPYFRFGRPLRLKVLKKFISGLGGRPARIVVMSRTEELTKDKFQQVALKEIPPLLKSGQMLKILSVTDNNENKLHARYLLSIKGAIKYDKGFEESVEKLMVDVEYVSETLHDQLIELFIEGHHGFAVDEEIVIRPNDPRR